MPTNLIGRFNELLHNLSSSSSNSNPSSSSNNTTSTTTQQQCRRHPPTRSSSSRTVSTTNNNQQQPQQHHHQHNTNHHSRSSSSNRGRNVVVKRSSSSNQQNNKQILNTNNNNHHHSRSNRHNKNNTSNHEGSSTNKCEIDSSQNLHRNQQYRQHHRSSSSSQCRHLSHSSSTSKHESNNLDSNNLHQLQQNQSRRHLRRHSIESLTSVANNNNNNNNNNIKKSANLHPNRSGKLISSSSYNNTENNSSIMIASKNNKNINNNNNNNINLKNPSEEKHGNNENNTKDNFGAHSRYFPVIMKPPIARNNSTNNNNNNNNQDIDESLTSMLVRKMRIGAITRKNLSQNPTQIFHKKISKIAKKDVESELDDGDSKNSFIYRYLDGHLTKQHPDIISGKTCYDMPVKDIEILETKVVAACTGPNGGLLTVNSPTNKPFELAVDDVDFIDEDYPDSSLSSNGCCESTSPSPQNSAKLLSSTSTVSTDTGEGTVTFSNCDDTDKSSPYKKNSSYSEPIAGVDNWNRSSDFAYGISTTLYESHPSTKQKAGDPIADSYGICVRENSAILALADGVNWGEGACLASRCAIHGCIDYLNKALYSTAESTRSRNTMDIFIALLRSFNAAHNTILSQGGHLTTLCVAVICQLKDSDRFIVCTCNVGDSLAYVYSTCHGVREITQGSHDIFSMRDMRDALGALGPVSGSEPELNNLTVAMTIVDVGDIVFLTSDGISDNFDPVVGKFAIPKKEQPQDGEINEATDKHSSKKACENLNLMAKQSKKKNGNTTTGRKIVQRSNSNPEKSSARHLNYTSKGLPLVSAQQRHELTLLRMEDLIMNGVNNISLPKKKTARELCSLMVDFSTKLTMAKRRILEDPELYSEDEEERPANEIFEKQRRRRRLVGQKLAQVPGKLDHATIAAVEIGFHGLKAREMAANKKFRQPMYNSNNKHSLEARYNLKLKATLARFESQDSLESINEAGPI